VKLFKKLKKKALSVLDQVKFWGEDVDFVKLTVFFFVDFSFDCKRNNQLE